MTTSTEVPGRFPVAINGVPFALWEEPDTIAGPRPAIAHQSVPVQREQAAGASANIGEQTVNPLGFWRRSRDGWHDGQGQSYGDRNESDDLRYRTSAGIDVFGTHHQLTLQHRCDLAATFTPGVPLLLTANGRVYFSDGTTLVYTTTPTTTAWSASSISGVPAGGIDGMCSFADQIYLACGTDGIYSGSAGGSSVSSFVTGTVGGVAAAKGRMMAWAGNVLYNIVAGGALPTPLVTFGSGYIVGITGAANWIYVALYGDPSQIYKTTIKPDGTALDVPSVAGELPEGESLVNYGVGSAIFSYLNRLFVLTNRGVRMGTVDSNGDITFGSIIPTDRATNIGAWAAYDRFVWVGAGDANGAALGTIKMDLSTEILPNTPAYANDLDPGHVVQALTVYGGQLVMADNTGNVWIESSDHYVTSGHLDSGLWALDLTDTKTPVAVDMEAALPSSTTIAEAISVDRGSSFTTVGTWTAAAPDEKAVAGVAAARSFEMRVTLNASSDKSDTPVLYRHTLKVEPNVDQSRFRQYKLNLSESVQDQTGTGGGYGTGRTPATDLAALEALQQARTVVQCQEGDVTYNGTIREVDFDATSRCQSANDGTWNGVCTVTIKELPA